MTLTTKTRSGNSTHMDRTFIQILSFMIHLGTKQIRRKWESEMYVYQADAVNPFLRPTTLPSTMFSIRYFFLLPWFHHTTPPSPVSTERKWDNNGDFFSWNNLLIEKKYLCVWMVTLASEKLLVSLSENKIWKCEPFLTQTHRILLNAPFPSIFCSLGCNKSSTY